MARLPTGTVTFLFTDVEGSTRLLQELGERYHAVQERHLRLLREAIAHGEGVELRTEGDAFFAVFRSAVAAVRAAVHAQRALAAAAWPHGEPLRVRMGMHTGEGRLGGDDYLGIDVNRAARIAAAGHGGQVLVSDATRGLVERELPAGVAVRDLGEHRLKDFDRPQRLYDLVIDGLPSEFPPIRTLEVPTNLPVPATSFVGRTRELDRLDALIEEERLVTLTGPGGTGKTRLALRAATAAAERFPDGAYFVDLAPITDPALVPSTIAGALGVREQGARPLLDTLKDELRDRRQLLVLDNFEQILDAAPVVGDLLSAAPGSRFVVTSRAPLRVRGEQEFAVPPLELPDRDEDGSPERLSAFASVSLFVERARAVDRHFELTEANAAAVAEICARLDGLPLAIELAASRVKILTPEAIRERLERRLPLLTGGARDAPERHRTLRATIEWSHELLDEAARTVFRRLAVFSGGWTLDAAEAVTNASEEAGVDVLDGLARLVDESLVVREPEAVEPRFRMLETIREYGLERLAGDDDQEAVRRRHAEHFAALAERAGPRVRGPEQGRSVEVLEAEHDNIRAALAWAIERGEAELALRTVGPLWRFWQLRAPLAEGRRWADQALALEGAAGRTALRARALAAQGGLAYWQNDHDTTRHAYDEALAIARELADPALLAEATYNASFIPAIEGDPARGIALSEESRRLFEEAGDRQGIADAFASLSVMNRMAGDHAAALRYAEEALAAHRELGDPFGTADAHGMAAYAAFSAGDVERAEAHGREALQMTTWAADTTGTAAWLDLFAAGATQAGDHLRAIRLGGASDMLKETAGGQAPPVFIALEDPREAAREVLSEDEIAAAWEQGRSMTLEQAAAFALEGGEPRQSG